MMGSSPDDIDGFCSVETKRDVICLFRREDYRYWATKLKYFLGPCEDVGLRNIFSYDIQRYLLKLPGIKYWYKRQAFVKFPTCSTVDTASTYIFKQLNYIIV